MPWQQSVRSLLRGRIFRFVILCVMAVVTLAAILLAIRWPFTQQRVLESLRESWPGSVQLQSVRSTYFPHPGCVAEQVVLRASYGHSDNPTIVAIPRAQIRANYFDLFLRPGRMAHLSVDGLRIETGAVAGNSHGESSESSSQPETDNSSTSSVTFAQVDIRDGAVIVHRSGGKDPLTFSLMHLTLGSVHVGSAMSFEGLVSNPLPPGQVELRGRFGPWASQMPGETPLSGSYTFTNADLGVFRGIAGLLSSSGTFAGTLGSLEAKGDIAIPSFEVTRAHHPVDLKSNYNAVIDAMNGDVTLKQVDSSFLRTAVTAKGAIASMPGKHGKTASLDLDTRHGQIQDVLQLFVQSKTPPMNGATQFTAHVTIPPGAEPFLTKVALNGHFAIENAVLTNPKRQDDINQLSKRASGNKDQPQTESVSGRINGDVQLQKGSALFSALSFEIPGAEVQMKGRYQLTNEKIDLHGDAKTEASLSQDTTGIKSVLLKPVNWIFKKKHAGADVRVGMTGTYDDPHFGIEVPVKK